MKRFLKKQKFLRTFLILFLSFVLLLAASAGLQALRFHRLSYTLFRNEMSADTLSMHYTIAFPEKYGIPDDTVCLMPYSRETQSESFRQLTAYAKTTSSIKAPLLMRDSRELLLLLREHLRSRQSEEAFPYYAEPLSPGAGIQSTLPVLLAEYTFRTKQDAENYLCLLSMLPSYLDGITAYEKEKADAGLFMSDRAADEVIEQCYEILSADKIADGSHFLCTTFETRLQTLIEAGLLTTREAEDYKTRNHSLLLEALVPAYESLGDSMLLLKGSGKNDGGLANLPCGKDYYTQLFIQMTGCSRPISSVKQLLLKRLKADTEALARIIRQYPDLPAMYKNDFLQKLSSEEMLNDLQKRMQSDFPEFPNEATSPGCTVKQVAGSLEDYCAPAFYLTPPIDDNSENSIYINQKQTPSGIELYTTLAHEGYPGHLYQTVYYQLYQKQRHANPACLLLHYGGYSEGWALYVEMLSYDYVKEHLSEHGAAEKELLSIDAMRLNRSIQLCLYSLLDLEIHYTGADFEDVNSLLQSFGINDAAISRSIYDHIVWEPANYPKYYVGCLEFEMLKEAAQKKWKNDYSDIRFHKMVLESGPCPFDFLWKKLT